MKTKHGSLALVTVRPLFGGYLLTHYDSIDGHEQWIKDYRDVVAVVENILAEGVKYETSLSGDSPR